MLLEARVEGEEAKMILTLGAWSTGSVVMVTAGLDVGGGGGWTAAAKASITFPPHLNPARTGLSWRKDFVNGFLPGTHFSSKLLSYLSQSAG